MGTTVAKRLVVTGRVQGVGFRHGFAVAARALGLRGWVRNCRNGDVEAIVVGPAADVDAIIAWSRQGPPAAHVTAVSIEPASGEFAEFEIAPTN